MSDRHPLPYAFYAAVIFSGSFLLFVVQPLIAKMALPMLGGAPAVWNSAMVVFQLLLLGGYIYAHLLAKQPAKRQAIVHVALLAVSALTLPLGLIEIPAAGADWQVLRVPILFAASIGPTFLLLSAQASLLQRWYAAVPEGRNPYGLYAISNLGSFSGLAAYPFLIEPLMTATRQSWAWSAGFLLVGATIAIIAWFRRDLAEATADRAQQPDPKPIPLRTRFLWLALAAVPSGLVLSTTTLLTTDLMAMPLLWVIPLGLYLLSFSVAFSEHGEWTRILDGYAPLMLLAIGGMAMVSGGQINAIIAVAMVGLLFILSVTLHGRLYRSRPPEDRLTLFYIFIAVGGALGGIFVAIIAPVMFDWVYEHIILLVAAALLLPSQPVLAVIGRWRDRFALIPIVLLGVAAITAHWLSRASAASAFADMFMLFAALIAIGLVLAGKRWHFAAVFVMILVSLNGLSLLQSSTTGDRARSYFGVYNVDTVENGRLRRLTHGTTMHGQQWLTRNRRKEPTAYYGKTSGVGLVLKEAPVAARIGVVGLGVGTLACYRTPGQEWTFFEIDPVVVDYAKGDSFSFLADCAPDAKIVVGDARVRLTHLDGGTFDVLVLDAFSSDAIPLHLVTREAFDVYDRAVAPDGLLVLHVSNRFIDLAPSIAALASERGWKGSILFDRPGLVPGISDSDWIVLTKGDRDMSSQVSSRWRTLPAPSDRILTDENASLLPLIKF